MLPSRIEDNRIIVGSKGEIFKRSGRSRIAESIRNLVRRISGENLGWSDHQVCGERKKLGIFIGDTLAFQCSKSVLIYRKNRQPRPLIKTT